MFYWVQLLQWQNSIGRIYRTYRPHKPKSIKNLPKFTVNFNLIIIGFSTDWIMCLAEFYPNKNKQISNLVVYCPTATMSIFSSIRYFKKGESHSLSLKKLDEQLFVINIVYLDFYVYQYQYYQSWYYNYLVTTMCQSLAHQFTYNVCRTLISKWIYNVNFT